MHAYIYIYFQQPGFNTFQYIINFFSILVKIFLIFLELYLYNHCTIIYLNMF